MHPKEEWRLIRSVFIAFSLMVGLTIAGLIVGGWYGSESEHERAMAFLRAHPEVKSLCGEGWIASIFVNGALGGMIGLGIGVMLGIVLPIWKWMRRQRAGAGGE